MRETTEVVRIQEDRFYEQLNLSQSTIRSYRNAINSKYLKGLIKSAYGVESIFEITDLKLLWNLYSNINVDTKNINSHRAYSAAIMKYIRFLNNGNRYGRRIDFNKKKSK